MLGAITVFAVIFMLFFRSDPSAFSEELDPANAILYSASAWANGGGAGISVNDGWGRAVTVIETLSA